MPFLLSALAKLRALQSWAKNNPAAAKAVGVLVVLAALVVLGMAATVYVGRLHDRIAQLALERTNADAERDTTRAVALSRKDSLRLLGDSLAMVQRLVVQRTQERDDVDKALHQVRVAKVTLEAKVDSLSVRHVASSAPVRTDSAGDRSASFHVRREPFTADALVTLPASGPGALDLSVRLDSASLRARIGCGDARDGIRPALVTLETPTWLHATVTNAEQDTRLCNAQLSESGPVKHWRPALSFGPSYNVVHLPDGTWRSGWGASVQLAVLHWP
jgi:hypothetical protein